MNKIYSIFFRRSTIIFRERVGEGNTVTVQMVEEEQKKKKVFVKKAELCNLYTIIQHGISECM